MAGQAGAPRFGTDGVRGLANVDLTPEDALLLGRAAGRRLGAERIVVGRDTRISGSMLEAALCAGLASEGMDVDLLGVGSVHLDGRPRHRDVVEVPGQQLGEEREAGDVHLRVRDTVRGQPVLGLPGRDVLGHPVGAGGGGGQDDQGHEQGAHPAR